MHAYGRKGKAAGNNNNYLLFAPAADPQKLYYGNSDKCTSSHRGEFFINLKRCIRHLFCLAYDMRTNKNSRFQLRTYAFFKLFVAFGRRYNFLPYRYDNYSFPAGCGICRHGNFRIADALGDDRNEEVNKSFNGAFRYYLSFRRAEKLPKLLKALTEMQ